MITIAPSPTQADKYYPTPTGGDDHPELESLLAAGETDIQMRSGTYNLLSGVTGIAGLSNVKIRGAGINRTLVRPTPTTGNIFDLTGSSFCEISDMSIVPTAQRTAGAVIFLDNGGGSCQQNNIRRILLSSSFIGIQLNNTTTTVMEDIQIGDLNNTWPWQSAIYLNGTAISTTLNRLRGGTAAGMTSGIVRLNASGIDTFHGADWDVLNQTPSSGMNGLFVAGGTWAKLVDCSIECGNLPAVTITGGTGTHLISPHTLGQILISGGNDLQIDGGTNVLGGALPVRITAGVGTTIQGLTVQDAPAGATCIRAENGVNDFKIMNCDLGRAILGLGGTVTTLVQVGTSANAQDRYIIDLNTGRNFSGTALVDNGTGTNKRVGAVPTSNVFVP